MPLSSFMFKHKHTLWCISARYFQLSRVNLYLFTFTVLMLCLFSYFKKIRTVSSNFYVAVSACARLGELAVKPFNNAFSPTVTVNKKRRRSGKCLSLRRRERAGHLFQTQELSAQIKEFADAGKKIRCVYSVDGIYLFSSCRAQRGFTSPH